MDRSGDLAQRFAEEASGSSRSSCRVVLVLVAGRHIGTTATLADGSAEQTQPQRAPSAGLLLPLRPALGRELQLADGGSALQWLPSDGAGAMLPLYLLGRESAGDEAWVCALDISAAPPAELLAFLGAQLGCRLQLRSAASLLPLLDAQARSVAGQAVALAQWHQGCSYCSSCGRPTRSVDAGTRRACSAGHRAYPRVDPAVLVLVESPDGHAVLLGRPAASHNRRGGSTAVSGGAGSKGSRISKIASAAALADSASAFATCLSGFVEAAEAPEAAAHREVREEAGLELAHVTLLPTAQPWPLGRHG